MPLDSCIFIVTSEYQHCMLWTVTWSFLSALYIPHPAESIGSSMQYQPPYKVGHHYQFRACRQGSLLLLAPKGVCLMCRMGQLWHDVPANFWRRREGDFCQSASAEDEGQRALTCAPHIANNIFAAAASL